MVYPLNAASPSAACWINGVVLLQAVQQETTQCRQIHFYIQVIPQNRGLAVISGDDTEIPLNPLTHARRETIQVSPVYR